VPTAEEVAQESLLKVSRGSVKSHTSRGMAALRTALLRD